LLFLGIQGIYPSGNFCEHHQGDIKGTKDKAGIIDLNVSMLSFVSLQAPKLMKHERVRTSHLFAGRRVFPVEPSRTAVAIFRCMRPGVDLIECCDKETDTVVCWLGNRAHFVGKPLKPMKDGKVDLSRMELYDDAVAGKPERFLELNGNRKAEAAMHMVNLANGICRVVLQAQPRGQPPIIIGDCPTCFKKLGRDCPVVLAVREKIGDFGNTSIADRMMSKVQPHELDGPSKASGLRGLNKVLTKKNPGWFADNSKEFWKYYRDKNALSKIVIDLLQIPVGCEQGKARKAKPKSMSKEQAFQLVQSFERCPTCFRGKTHDWDCNLRNKRPTEEDIDYAWPLKKLKL
jgi:hypothetical protein